MDNEIRRIKKRNGELVLFDEEKITEDVFKAVKAVGEDDYTIAKSVSKKVTNVLNIFFKSKHIPTIDNIQDLIEKTLIEEGHVKIAKAYILYREQRNKLRQMQLTLLDIEGTMNEYLKNIDWRINENSNVGFSLGGLILYISGKITANYWLNNIYQKEVSEAHRNGDFHVHDLSMFSGYCAGWSIKQLLEKGFGGVRGHLQTVPAKHLDTVISQMVNFLGTLQNEWAGAQAFSSVDTYLAPFVRADNMTYKETKQCIQRLIFHLATPSRWGTQCVPIDTEALTEKGWKKYNQIKNEKIATFNIKTGKIEYLKPSRVLSYNYNGYLVNLKNRSQDQLVTPDHKVVIKKGKNYEFIVAEDLLKLKDSVEIPAGISGLKNVKGKLSIKRSKLFYDTKINITSIKKVKFKGKVWCPTTKNGTFVARRNGKVFITGNTPFINFTLDWTVPEDIKDDPAIVGGKKMDYTYGDCKKEMDMINKAFIEVMIEGDASGRIFTFPIPTYNVTPDFDWDSENANLLFDMTAKYGIPYFQNFINSDLKPDDVRSMCCRLRLDKRELRKKTGGLFGNGELTGSIGVVTINLPRIGYLSATKEEFFEKLSRLMEIARGSLELKRKVIEKHMMGGLLPFTKAYLGSFDNHFNTIGLLGMNECLLNFLGKEFNIGTRKGKAFAEEILDFMRKKLADYQEETGGMLYNLEATPAEGCSYRLAKIDRKKYSDIITAGTPENPYYTNSSQLPVNFTNDIFEALELQDSLQSRYTGGCVEKGNKVLTDKGLLNIEYIVKNFEKLKPIKTLSYNSKKGLSEWDDIVEAVDIDIKKYHKIRVLAERNLDITTSDWHPFFVVEKINEKCPLCEKKMKNVKAFANHLKKSVNYKKKYFLGYKVIEKRADQLKKGDYILQNSDNLYQNKKTELDKNLMWLIGFFIGDGCISKYIDNRGKKQLVRYDIRFHSEQIKALEKVKQNLSKYFNSECSVIKNDKRSNVLREVSSKGKKVIDFFFKYGFKLGKKADSINVPKEVKKNINKTNIFALLSGLMDSDGHIGKRDGNFEYYTVSSKLAEDILEICSCAGVMVHKKEKIVKRKNESNIYKLIIPTYELTKIKKNLSIKEKKSNRNKRHLPVVRVKNVSKVDVKDNLFYDLMTKNNHNYLAGKDTLVFIHNTVLHGFLGEQVSDPETCKKLVKRIAYNFRLPYFTISPTFSVCPVHGYMSGKHETCPYDDEDVSQNELFIKRREVSGDEQMRPKV